MPHMAVICERWARSAVNSISGTIGIASSDAYVDASPDDAADADA